MNRSAEQYSHVSRRKLLEIGDLVVINNHVSHVEENIFGIIVSTQRKKIRYSRGEPVSSYGKDIHNAGVEVFFIVMTPDSSTNLHAFPRYMLRRL